MEIKITLYKRNKLVNEKYFLCYILYAYRVHLRMEKENYILLGKRNRINAVLKMEVGKVI